MFSRHSTAIAAMRTVRPATACALACPTPGGVRTGHEASLAPAVYAVFGGKDAGMGAMLADSMQGGPMGFSFQDMKWSAKASSKDLGTRDFDGIRAEGRSLSYTIPAGEIGNKNPLTVTRESWYSPELQITVYARQSDPRTGETIYRLASIKRNEQPIALFRAPADYKVKEVPRFGFEFKTGKDK
jgi:hypothetical protein